MSHNIEEKEGLYGTVGLVLHDRESYMNHTRYGWPNPNEETKQVDLVGHSWFFKRKWLEHYWNDLPPTSGYDFMGEDMHMSYAIQKHLGLGTYVPPHPPTDKELWGSLKPERGVDQFAISISGKATRMNFAIKRLFKLGWRLCRSA